MILTQAILEHWEADETLNGQLPATQVTVGPSSDVTLPYATIRQKATVPDTPTNAGHASEKAVLLVDVWDRQYDSGLDTVEYLKAAFDWCELLVGIGQGTARLRCVDGFSKHHDDGTWQFRVELHANCYA